MIEAYILNFYYKFFVISMLPLKKTFTNQTYWSPIEPILIDTSKQFLREAIIHIISNITKKRVGFSFEAS